MQIAAGSGRTSVLEATTRATARVRRRRIRAEPTAYGMLSECNYTLPYHLCTPCSHHLAAKGPLHSCFQTVTANTAPQDQSSLMQATSTALWADRALACVCSAVLRASLPDDATNEQLSIKAACSCHTSCVHICKTRASKLHVDAAASVTSDAHILL
jgi:hypothetical protein